MWQVSQPTDGISACLFSVTEWGSAHECVINGSVAMTALFEYYYYTRL